MSLKRLIFVAIVLVVTGLTLSAAQGGKTSEQPPASPKQTPSPTIPPAELGKLIFSDTSLSRPPGLGCITCHNPRTAFADSHALMPGAVAGRRVKRNAPTLMYAALVPDLTMEEAITPDGEEIPAWEGGLLLGGGAHDLFDLVQKPFFMTNEFNIPNVAAFAAGLRNSAYAEKLRKAIGDEAWNDDSRLTYHAYRALVEFLQSPMFRPFNARIDDYLAGDKSALNESEKRGLEVFNGAGKCAECHWLAPKIYPSPVLTDYGYDNDGVPSRGEKDPGLEAQTKNPEDLGRFRAPTLRNIALTAPYMHNGTLATLKEVMEFYNQRDVTPERWGATDYPATVNHKNMGNLKLTDQQVDDLVALMSAFTDRNLLDMKPGQTFPDTPANVPSTEKTKLFFSDWTYRLHPAYRKELSEHLKTGS